MPIKYQPDIYEINHNNSCRYALGMSGSNPLYVVGLNPSTADDKQADQTIRRVMGFAQRHAFDGFVMLNLYPQRTPYPTALHKKRSKALMEENINNILMQLKQSNQPSFLAAWGATLSIRKYLPDCLFDLHKATQHLEAKWLKIGALTKTGHPRHPSRAPYDMAFTHFDMKSYLEALMAKKS